MRYKLSDLFELQMGKTPSRNNPNYWNSNDYSWVSISDMSSYDKYVSGTKEYISEQAVKESRIKTIPANTVIMSFKLSIGKTAITTGPIFSNEAIMAFIDKKTIAIDPEYIFYLFSGKDWDEGSNKAVMGKTLNKATLSNIEVDIPSLDIQKERIENLNKISILISDKKQQLNQLDELIKARFVELFGDGFETTELRNICKTTSGGTPSTKNPDYYKGTIPWVTTTALGPNHIDGTKAKAYISEEAVANSATKIIPSGSILFGIRVGVGKTSINDVDICTNQDIVAIMDVNETKFSKLFIKHVLDANRAHYDSLKKGATILGITSDDLKNTPIPLAQIKAQKDFETFVEQVDKSKFAVQKSLEKTQLLFDSLMQEYFG